jgi:DNA-binding response OmpR family regulator
MGQTELVPPRKPGVLVVAEEGSVRTVLTLLLRQHGFVVWQAAGAAEARPVQAQHPEAIDVVLVDTGLADLDVRTLLESLRGIRADLGCCFLSAGPGDFSEEELSQLGVAHLFTRPFQLAEIAKELHRVVTDEEPVAPSPTPEPRSMVIDVAEPPGDERRGSVRYRCDLENSCQPLAASRTADHWQGQVVDLSVGGARVVLGRRFEVGTMLVLSVTKSAGEDTHRLLARVVRVSQEPDGRWDLGCSFTSPLADDDLRDLLT